MIADSFVTRHSGSARDDGSFLNVITWILLITSALAVLTRLVTKKALHRRIDVDDIFVIAALITSIGSGVAVSLQVANGLGRDVSTLVKAQVVAYEKCEYATKLLYISTLAFAKLSIISLLLILTASELHRRMGISLAAFIGVWGFTSEFAAAFQCSRPHPWDTMSAGQDCINMTAFWRATAIINMVTDLALILYPMHVIVTLQMSTGKKLTILTFFGARSLSVSIDPTCLILLITSSDIIATGIQLAYTNAYTSLNPTMALWKWTLTTQIVECITIITSCVPYLRPLLEAIPSGKYGAAELRRHGHPSSLGYQKSSEDSYKLSEASSKTPKSRKSGGPESESTRYLSALSMNSSSGLPDGPKRPDGQTLGVEITSVRTGNGEGKWETESQGSQAKILKTTTMTTAWEVTARDNPGDEIQAHGDECM